MNKTLSRALTAVLAVGATSASADILHLDDVIIDGSLCVGFDCVNGEAFGFDTIRIKENNLRIKAQDTSSTASFPSNDWQITFNDTTNGGQNKFSIDDIDGGRTPFTIEAGAPSHSLYVDDGGRVGFGTSTPVADLHVKSGNTPTLRLEQDGSSGFGAQTWDVAGNEANFFIRDATSGSTLPFRIFPGAPSNALTIEATGDIGMGTTSPDERLEIEQAGPARLGLTNTSATDCTTATDTQCKKWTLNSNGTFRITGGADSSEFELLGDGTLRIRGGLVANWNGAAGDNFPDYVFDPDYSLMPLHEVKSFVEKHRHLPEIPSGKEVSLNGLNMTDMQIRLVKKVEELMLYTLQQHAKLEKLEQQLALLESDKH